MLVTEKLASSLLPLRSCLFLAFLTVLSLQFSTDLVAFPLQLMFERDKRLSLLLLATIASTLLLGARRCLVPSLILR